MSTQVAMLDELEHRRVPDPSQVISILLYAGLRFVSGMLRIEERQPGFDVPRPIELGVEAVARDEGRVDRVELVLVDRPLFRLTLAVGDRDGLAFPVRRAKERERVRRICFDQKLKSADRSDEKAWPVPEKMIRFSALDPTLVGLV